MKKLLLLPFFLLLSSMTFAATEQDKNAANFLAQKGIIQTSSDYKLDSTITRREMLKVMMNLSGKPIATTCSGKFKDLPSSDWGCKYAEAALANGYISANSYFRPNDSVTQAESLKMIMQAIGISPVGEGSWEQKYRYAGIDYGLLAKDFEYSQQVFSQRKFVFLVSAKTFEDYGVGVTLSGEYTQCYMEGNRPCVKLSMADTDKIQNNGGVLFLHSHILQEPGRNITFKLISQKKGCEYSEEGLGCNIRNSEIEVLSGIKTIGEKVFDSCGTKDTYVKYSWYSQLEKDENFGGGDIVEMCFSEDLGFVLFGVNYNGYYSIQRYWIDGNSHVEFMNTDSKFSHSSFVEFGKRDINIIPITLVDTNGTKKTIKYNFVEDKITN